MLVYRSRLFIDCIISTSVQSTKLVDLDFDDRLREDLHMDVGMKKSFR